MEIVNLLFLLSFLAQGNAQSVNTDSPNNVLEMPIKLHGNVKFREAISERYKFNGPDFEISKVNHNLLNIHDRALIELGRRRNKNKVDRSSKTRPGYSTENSKAKTRTRPYVLRYVKSNALKYITKRPRRPEDATTKKFENLMDWINFDCATASANPLNTQPHSYSHSSGLFLTLAPNRITKEPSTPQQGVLRLESLD